METSPTTNPGPLDPCVLYDQDKHVSSAVWDGQERGALRCHEHTSKLGEWRLMPRQIELVEKAGFGYLRKIPAISLDNPLISALVERWRRETNTFHFIVGEMTVTLQDVALMLGLAIDGKPVIGVTHTTCSSICHKYLGKAPDSNHASGGMVKLSWLKEYFSNCPENALTEEVERHTRAYLLYLVGSTIFSTTTGNKVPVMYLPLFGDFEDAGTYAWGAATLAFLYRALGNASVKSQSTICGCLTLLQCWSYYHLNIGRPKLHRDPVHDHFPFVLRWKGKQSGPTINRDVIFYRKALDSLKPSDVEWLPYKYIDSTVIPEDIKSTLILGRSRTMLICFDKAERHLPDRCLRQYGMLQAIPEDVPRWVRKSRGVDGGVDLSGKMESELSEWSDRRLHVVDDDENADENVYMQWYLRITRKVVGRPISLSSEFQRTISGLRDIAYLADTFSTKGLDAQQYESISRIRCIAEECLRDQVESQAVVTATPVTELGKRSRGKERVRRKNSGKRKRDNYPMEGPAASEDESQLCGAIVEVDQIHLPHASVDVHHLQLTHAVRGSDPQMCFDDAVEKVDDSELCDAANEVDDCQLYDAANVVNGSQFYDATAEVIDSQFTHVVSVDDPQTVKVSEEVVMQSSQLYDTSNDVNDSKIYEATDEEVKDSQMSQISNATDEVGGTQIPDSTADANNLQTYDKNAEVDDSQICDTTVKLRGTQVSGEPDTYTAKMVEEVVSQSSLGTVEDVAKQGDDNIIA
ncbi:protein MAIN-LIKE 2-like [Mangifera indica]|uniref:protein MAIN-LIKE 2-like n=1 Tax=Mangifera indica TaxID=29780 RepID=UPI001CFB14B3|nr:protein MAIN-LIKE 2-like [Mangifera indica]